MSDIKVGDLVMVVKPVGCGCSRSHDRVGVIFTVEQITLSAGKCVYCKSEIPVSPSAYIEGRRTCVEFHRLLKIDPPPFGEDATENLELQQEV